MEENELEKERQKAVVENIKDEMAENLKVATKKLESEVKCLSSKLKKSEKELEKRTSEVRGLTDRLENYDRSTENTVLKKLKRQILQNCPTMSIKDIDNIESG